MKSYLVILSMMPFIMASSCQVNAAMRRVRNVHTGIVAAFRTVDDQVAPRYEEAGDRCISEVEQLDLEGVEARDAARACMNRAGWNDLERALSTAREILAELENIYNDIEAGGDRLSDWHIVARRLLVHGRQLTVSLNAAGVDVPPDLLSTLETLCDLTNCEREEN